MASSAKSDSTSPNHVSIPCWRADCSRPHSVSAITTSWFIFFRALASSTVHGEAPTMRIRPLPADPSFNNLVRGPREKPWAMIVVKISINTAGTKYSASLNPASMSAGAKAPADAAATTPRGAIHPISTRSCQLQSVRMVARNTARGRTTKTKPSTMAMSCQ